jgi:hypothetical protein
VLFSIKLLLKFPSKFVTIAPKVKPTREAVIVLKVTNPFRVIISIAHTEPNCKSLLSNLPLFSAQVKELSLSTFAETLALFIPTRNKLLFDKKLFTIGLLFDTAIRN